MLKLYQIEKMVIKINKNLCLDKTRLPSFGTPNENNPTFVKVTKDGYLFFEYDPYRDKKDQHLIVRTIDIDELLFEIFKDSTRYMATEYEFKHRVPNQDTRIIMFDKHIEILNSLKLDEKYITKLMEYYHYLLQLKKPPPIPDNW